MLISRIKEFILVVVVVVGRGVSILDGEEEKQCDHSSAAMSRVLQEHSVHDISTGYGGFHQCSHTEGNCFFMLALLSSEMTC